MNKPKMILFDYGGTLLYEPGFDLVNGERKIFEHIINNPNKLTPEELSYFESEYFNNLQKVRELKYEVNEIQILKFKYEYNEIDLDISYEEAERILWENAAPISIKARTLHVLEMLNFLKKEKIRSGVISNLVWSGSLLRERINTLLPNNTFEFVLASSEYGLRKPDKQIFELALKKARMKPEDVWYCGDTYTTDIIGAHDAGIFPVFYQGDLNNCVKRDNYKELLSFEHVTIFDWRELIELISTCV